METKSDRSEALNCPNMPQDSRSRWSWVSGPIQDIDSMRTFNAAVFNEDNYNETQVLKLFRDSLCKTALIYLHQIVCDAYHSRPSCCKMSISLFLLLVFLIYRGGCFNYVLMQCRVWQQIHVIGRWWLKPWRKKDNERITSHIFLWEAMYGDTSCRATWE